VRHAGLAAAKIDVHRAAVITLRRRTPTSGFTLLELMIALLIVAILLGLALPSYQHYVQRGQRAEAVHMLLRAAACQERVRARSGYYDTSRCLDAFRSRYYSLRVVPPADTAAPGFRLIAEPLSAGPEDACGALSLDQAGRRGITGSALNLAACWGGR
jgi:type IV pilus assembly protein PilE